MLLFRFALETHSWAGDLKLSSLGNVHVYTEVLPPVGSVFFLLGMEKRSLTRGKLAAATQEDWA